MSFSLQDLKSIVILFPINPEKTMFIWVNYFCNQNFSRFF